MSRTRAFHNDTVDVLRPEVTEDRAGTKRLSYVGLRGKPGVARAGVQVRPVTSTEDVDDEGITVVTGWQIATRPRSGDWDVRAGDWLRLPDGTIVAVEGDPAKPTLFGRIHHVRVTATRAKG